jgi:hypothetical protein
MNFWLPICWNEQSPTKSQTIKNDSGRYTSWEPIGQAYKPDWDRQDHGSSQFRQKVSETPFQAIVELWETEIGQVLVLGKLGQKNCVGGWIW